MWANFDSRFNSLLSNIAYHSDLADRWANTANNVQAIERRREDLKRFEKQEKEWQASRLRAVLSWLGFSTHVLQDEVDNFIRERIPGSCDWLIERPETKLWLADDESNGLIWLHGKLGAGNFELQ